MEKERTVTELYYGRVMKKQLHTSKPEPPHKSPARPFFLKRIDKACR